MIGFLVSFLILPASAQDYEWKLEKMPYTHQNIQVPRKLWQTIKSILKDKKVEKKVIDNFTIFPITIEVELRNEKQPVLKKAVNHRLGFTDGGGVLDLFNYIDRKGRFFLRMQPFLIEGEDFHLLYVSDSPGKKIGEQVWGNGCGNIYDLTQNKKALLEDKGMLLTTAKRHYLHLMAGTYVFFQLIEEKMYMGYIRLKDSRYPQFTCENEA